MKGESEISAGRIDKKDWITYIVGGNLKKKKKLKQPT